MPSPWWYLTRSQAEPQYQALLIKEEGDDESDNSFPSMGPPRTPWWSTVFSILPWVLCLILSTALVIVVSDHRRAHRHGSYETGFDTDLEPANEALGITKVKFYGGPQIDENGTYSLTHNPDEPHFVGKSSPEIDRAWEDMLLHQRYLGLTPEEAARTPFEVDEKDWIFDKYWVSPNTFHTLHCLNHIRRSLDRDYYTDIQDHEPSPFRMTNRMHLDHCIESLRQTVQCSLDMTPVPRPWIPNAGIYHADIDQWHTCRDYSSVRKWMDWRNRDERDTDFNKTVTRKWKNKNALYSKYISW